MAEDRLARLLTIDPALLTEVVRQDQADPSFEITEWSVRRLSDKGVGNPDGLWLFHGLGRPSTGPARPWSVVLKILKRPEHESALDSRFYWKRELLVAQSGLAERFRGPVRAPRFYRTDESASEGWLWSEYVRDHSPGKWGLDDFRFAAYQLGWWNGANLKRPLPAEPWLIKKFHREPESVIHLEEVWQNPLHEKYATPDIRHRFERLWQEREQFYSVLEQLPQCFAHSDFQRRNLFIQQNPGSQDAPLILIDWALCTVGALGAELQGLVGTSTNLVEWPSSEITALDRATFQSYLQGLSDAGWQGNPDTIRLAYTAMMAIYRGSIHPMFMGHWWATPETRESDLGLFGIAGEALYLHLLPILLYLLDCADEARTLMKKLRVNGSAGERRLMVLGRDRTV